MHGATTVNAGTLQVGNGGSGEFLTQPEHQPSAMAAR